MVVIYAEGFDDNNEDDQTQMFHSSNAGGLDNDGGRFGGGAARAGDASSNARYWQIDIDPTNTRLDTQLVIGFAYNPISIKAARPVMLLNAAEETIGEIRHEATTMKLELYDSNGTLVIRSSTQLSAGVWFWIETKWTTGASGACELRLDQGPTQTTAAIDESALDFMPTSTDNKVKFLRFRGPAATGGRWDDLHVLDFSGSFNNDFLGDGRLIHLRPDSDVQADYTPSTGGDNFALVDEALHDETDFVSSSTFGDRDRYTFEDTTNPPDQVDFLYLNSRVAKTDAGGTRLKQHITSGATTATSAAKILSTTDLYYHYYHDFDPADSSAWTQAKVDALQGGVEVA